MDGEARKSKVDSREGLEGAVASLSNPVDLAKVACRLGSSGGGVRGG